MLQLRLLPPRSYRERHRLPEWEVVDEAGAVVGWIAEHAIPSAGSRFFDLVALHPETGECIPLQLSADREERVEKLEQFLAEPDVFAQHYPGGSRAARALEERLGGPLWKVRQAAADRRP